MLHQPGMLINLMSTWHKLESSGKRDPQLRQCLRYDLREGIFLSSDQWVRVQPIVGGVVPGLVDLTSLRKQAKQVTGSKPVSLL